MRVRVDGKDVAADDSFEGSSNTINFFASTTYTHVLEPNTEVTIEAVVIPYGAGAEDSKDSKIDLNVVAIGGG